VHDFKRDRAIVPKIVGEKYGGHAATTELPVYAISIRKAALELLG
jgi:hypothetical protein